MGKGAARMGHGRVWKVPGADAFAAVPGTNPDPGRAPRQHRRQHLRRRGQRLAVIGGKRGDESGMVARAQFGHAGPPVPRIAADSNSDSNSNERWLAAATGDSA